MHEAVDAAGRGGALAMKLAEHPLPVLIASTGHAIAMGSLLLLAADFRIGIEGEFRYGLNEVMIGLTLPNFGAALADHRLSTNYYDRILLLGEFFGPPEAREAGFLDRVVAAEELDQAVAETVGAMAQVKPEAHRDTKPAPAASSSNGCTTRSTAGAASIGRRARSGRRLDSLADGRGTHRYRRPHRGGPRAALAARELSLTRLG